MAVQKKRDKKISGGTARGARRTRLDPVTKVLLGGGAFRRFKGIGLDPRTQSGPR